MAHKVTFSVPERPLANVDIGGQCRKNENMLGTLKSANVVSSGRKTASLGYSSVGMYLDQDCKGTEEDKAL